MKCNRTIRKALFAASLCACLGASGLGLSVQAADPQPHGAGAELTDTMITAKVKARFLDDARLTDSKIDVATTNGEVTLTGTASSADAASSAKELAAAVEGVKLVDNQLTTPTVIDSAAKKTDKAEKAGKKYASDGWITTKVKSQLLADSVTKGLDIGVKTSNGVVALYGTVGSDDTIQHAANIARTVKGVKSVDATGLQTSGS